MVPNAHYADAESRPNVTLRRIADGQSMALAFASGELDMAFNLPVEALPMLEAAEGETVSFPVAYQYMMWMNTASPALSDVRVRRAIDMAINRAGLDRWRRWDAFERWLRARTGSLCLPATPRSGDLSTCGTRGPG